jgi:predicted HTH transcriptional regulator
MGNKYIHQLILQGESQHLDFKYEISDAKKIARTLSAFANTEGGKLLVGVRDNGAIAGIHSDEEIFMVESAAHVFCRPKVDYTFKTWLINGKSILEVTVVESPLKPHFAPWKEDQWRAFVRVADENFIANSVMVDVWEKKLTGKPVLVKYNRIEETLLSYLKENTEISLSGFCKLCQIKYPMAKRILVNLVTIGILKIHFSENNATYRLE